MMFIELQKPLDFVVGRLHVNLGLYLVSVPRLLPVWILMDGKRYAY